jgi:hypothetical protein
MKPPVPDAESAQQGELPPPPTPRPVPAAPRALPTGLDTRKLAVPLVIIAIVLGTGVGLLLLGPDDQVQELGMELFKLGGQVIVVTVAGGYLVQQYNRRRQHQIAVSEFRRRVLQDLITAYRKTKRARRRLRSRRRSRAEGESGAEQTYLSLRDYDEQIDLLSDAQMDLEILVHELNTFGGAFKQGNAIRNHVAAMQKYLDRITDEYENVSGRFTAEEYVPLKELTMLPEFLISKRGSQWHARMTMRFQSALQLIQSERLTLS